VSVISNILIILSGLPGVGKTTVARELARQIDCVHVRIDSIEQAILDSENLSGPMNDSGYRVGYSVALDNLRVGRTVIADSVNPLAITRDAWADVGRKGGVGAVEIELVCADAAEHRRRIETRPPDAAGLRPLVWEDVLSRNYERWNREHIVINTAVHDVEQTVAMIREILPVK
jgi:predicted kinase